jgi:hypothetical protein
VPHWTVWLAFVAEFMIGYASAGQRTAFLRAGWFDIAITVVSPPFIDRKLSREPGASDCCGCFPVTRRRRALGLRSARRAFGHRKFHYVGLFTLASSRGVRRLSGREGIKPGYKVRWGCAAVGNRYRYDGSATETYTGDFGRPPCNRDCLDAHGIGAIGVFTATVASFFLEPKVEGT